MPAVDGWDRAAATRAESSAERRNNGPAAPPATATAATTRSTRDAARCQRTPRQATAVHEPLSPIGPVVLAHGKHQRAARQPGSYAVDRDGAMVTGQAPAGWCRPLQAAP